MRDSGTPVLAEPDEGPCHALCALHCVQERAPDIPLIVVTGPLSDEVGAACLKQGSADYPLSDCLGRLGEAVRQALAARDLRVQHRLAHEALRARRAALPGAVRARERSGRPPDAEGIELMHPDDVPYMQAAFAALLQTLRRGKWRRSGCGMPTGRRHGEL